MKIIRHVTLVFAILAIGLFIGCSGDDEGPLDISGVTLDLTEATYLAVDQFYASVVPNDEYALPKFAVYLKDANNGTIIACAGTSDGLGAAKEAGVYYGGLNVPFQPVSGVDSYEGFLFQLVAVEKDGDPCPATINNDDDVLGVSGEITVDALYGKVITTTNGLVRMMLKIQGYPDATLAKMVATLESEIELDQLEFYEQPPEGEEIRYYAFINEVDDTEGTNSCSITYEKMPQMREAGITYGALGLPFICKDGNELTLDRFSGDVVVHLWRQGEGNAEEIASTAPFRPKDFIGEEVEFLDGRGYLRIRDLSDSAFSRVTVSLEELNLVGVKKILYTQDPSGTPAIEVHIIDSDYGYSVACSGEAEGLTGVGQAGVTYDNLNARFVSAEDLKDLFGWESLKVAVVNRTGAARCPDSLTEEDNILGQTASVKVDELLDRELTLSDLEGNQKGLVELVVR